MSSDVSVATSSDFPSDSFEIKIKEYLKIAMGSIIFLDIIPFPPPGFTP